MFKHVPISDIVKSISITHKFDKPQLIFLNTSDIENGNILSKNYLPISKLKGQAKKTIKKDDILFSEIRPKNKRFAYIDFDATDDYVVSTKLMVLRKYNNDIDNKYFYYYLTSEWMLNQLQNRAENRIGSFPQITFDLLKEYKLPTPSILEQQRISKLLSLIDSKIKKNDEIITVLNNLIKEYYDFWFIQFDFPNEVGKPYKSSGGKMVWNKELKREIPEHWTVCDLIDIANITMGQSPPGASFNENGNGIQFFQGSTDFGNRFPTIRLYTTSPTRFAKQGDILLSVRAPVGSINLTNENCCIGRGLAALNSKNNAMVYLFQVLNNFKQIFDSRNVNGTTFGSITKDDLYTLKVNKPEDKVLDKFQDKTNKLFKLQNELELESQNLYSLRLWLLPLLMSGQIKVN